MDAARFDCFARTLVGTATRRTTLGLSVAGLLGALGWDETDAKKKGKNKKKCKKKCGPCQKCKKGKCKPKKAVGTPCGEGKQCFANGQCVACDVCSACTHTTLQGAVDAATPGATIQLCPGTYLTKTGINKSLTVVGAGPGEGGTVLDGQGLTGVIDINLGEGEELVLRRLTITGGVQEFGAGIYYSSGGIVTLEDVHVTGNHSSVRGGGIRNAGVMTLTNSHVSGNSASLGGGIANQGGTLTLSDSSTVTDNTATGGAGSGGGIHNDVDDPDGGTVAVIGGSSVTGNAPDDCVGTDAC
jgi:hypothetical protein